MNTGLLINNTLSKYSRGSIDRYDYKMFMYNYFGESFEKSLITSLPKRYYYNTNNHVYFGENCDKRSHYKNHRNFNFLSKPVKNILLNSTDKYCSYSSLNCQFNSIKYHSQQKLPHKNLFYLHKCNKNQFIKSNSNETTTSSSLNSGLFGILKNIKWNNSINSSILESNIARTKNSLKTSFHYSNLSKFDLFFLQIFDFGLSPTLYACTNIYNSIQESIDFKRFINVLQMPDTIISWYFITAIHVWMVVMSHPVHIIHTTVLSRRLTVLLMSDVERKIKHYHLGALMISRRELQKNIMNHFNGLAFDLDRAFSESDLAVAEVLYVYSLQFEFELSMNSIIILVDYMRSQLQQLEDNDKDKLIRGGIINWSNLIK